MRSKRILRRWAEGTPGKRLAADLGCDAKTVRSYLWAAQDCGLSTASPALLSDETVLRVIAARLQPQAKTRGDGWRRCEEHDTTILWDGRVEKFSAAVAHSSTAGATHRGRRMRFYWR